jgi:hypothetical protein
MQGTETNPDKPVLGMRGGFSTAILNNLSVCAMFQTDPIGITTIDREMMAVKRSGVTT